MFASLVGEGFDRPNADQQLPLDVNYAKVGEWLLGRKLLPQDWTKRLQVIQLKVSEAVKDLPPGFLGQFDGGDEAPVDYFRAKEILAKLEETAERGLLGSLKGAAGTWQRIVNAYEANLLHVAEAGLTLARNVDFEIPYLKKAAAKNQQLLGDLDRRKGEALKSAAAAAAEYLQECKAMGIAKTATASPAALRRALIDLTQELPELMEAAVKAVRAPEVGEAAKFYARFTEATGCDGAELPTLQEVQEGRTAGPDAAMLAAIASNDDTPQDQGPQVDWGLPSDDAGEVSGVAWATDTGAEDAAGISWDLGVIETEDAGADASHTGPDGGVGISWDIDISDTGEASMDTTAAAAPEEQLAQTAARETSANAAVAGPPEVQRLVADASYRARLLDDLYELRAFLAQRCSELGSNSAQLLPSAVSDADVDAAAAATLRSAVDEAISAFTGGRMVQLLSIATSASFRDRLASQLGRSAGQESKFKRAAAEAEARKTEAQRHLVAESAKLAVLLRRTREAKTEVETALGAKLARRINVQGEINAVLAQA